MLCGSPELDDPSDVKLIDFGLAVTLGPGNAIRLDECKLTLEQESILRSKQVQLGMLRLKSY